MPKKAEELENKHLKKIKCQETFKNGCTKKIAKEGCLSKNNPD